MSAEPSVRSESVSASEAVLASDPVPNALAPTAPLPNALVDDLAHRLNESNDRLLALFDLVALEVRSLDASERITRIITAAHRLLKADSIRVDGPFPAECGVVNTAHYLHAVRSDVGAVSPAVVEVRRAASRFRSPEQKLIEAMGSLISNSVRAHNLHQQLVAQEVVSREHRLAAQLAQGVLPDEGDMPTMPGFTIFGRTRPAQSAGGDLFTWAELDGGVGFAVGDVSGKGLPAAVLMSTVVNAINEAFRHHGNDGVAATMDVVNRWVWRALSEAGMFVTLALGRIDRRDHTISLVNAGHSPVVFHSDPYRAEPEPAKRVHATAPPIGVLETVEPEVWRQEMAPGSVLVLATDGFTEQMDDQEVMFGEDRFDRLVAQHSSVSAASELARRLFTSVELHGGREAQGDDQTLMVIRRDITGRWGER